MTDLHTAPVDSTENVSEPWWHRPAWTAVEIGILLACLAVILAPLHPPLLFADTTPAGGDMGAHVWGPLFLRDHLLPHFRLTGWAPDWYAGFPAYQFYMVVPSLLIVALNAGVQGPLAIVPFAISVAVGLWAVFRAPSDRLRSLGVVASVLIAVLGIGVPYGVAFKWASISGLLALPIAAYVLGRALRWDAPGPIVMAIATLPFLFDRGFTIYGGNIASTLAGEFAFSISLAFAVFYLAAVARGMETGKGWRTAALLLALVATCHLIPLFFAVAGTIVLFAMRPSRAGLIWTGIVTVVGALLSGFWTVPFVLKRDFLNDMGWEKLPNPGETLWKYLIPHGMKVIFFFAVVGLVLSLAFWVRAGLFCAGMTLLFGIAFCVTPQARLWNARLLPFYYLSLYLLAAVGVVEVVRSLALLAVGEYTKPPAWVRFATAPLVALIAIAFVAVPVQAMPGVVNKYICSKTDPQNCPEYATVAGLKVKRSFIDRWSAWNYKGYERKDTYPEYHGVVQKMAEIGRERGCGRAMWEYQTELDRYGTPMALMLLPLWTDGCIGSMEGLYFESATTTPFHFLTQSELSAGPSSAQRDLPYRGFDMTAGIRHLQLMGVKYYMATTTQAIEAADLNPDLTPVGHSGPWMIYEVADSPLVEALPVQPAVVRGLGNGQHQWLCPGHDEEHRCTGSVLDWWQSYADRTADQAPLVPITNSGPRAWERIDGDSMGKIIDLPSVDVTKVQTGTDSIRFHVDRVGVPMLVKASYFPNWKASGALGPYRVAPNLMVVVPTSRDVHLHYGYTSVDALGYLLTALGIGALLVIGRRRLPLGP